MLPTDSSYPELESIWELPNSSYKEWPREVGQLGHMGGNKQEIDAWARKSFSMR